MMLVRKLAFFLLLGTVAWGQAPVDLHVDARSSGLGPLRPIWKYFGYDEPNYTYTENGQKLVQELGALAKPVYIRTHFLLATGDGKPSLKWGSTNAYTEDASGHPIYDWTIVDRIIDTYLNAGAKPFVEIGFMPEALSDRPEPYRVEWKPGAPNSGYSAGWSYPPKDFAKWGELVSRWVQHEVDKYGPKEVASWYWEVWNEPDISYWHGTPEQYDELYDYAAAAVKKASPEARVGGPGSTGPAGPKAAAFLLQFLQHCDGGKNFATRSVGAPLDFITYHAKGQPKVDGGQLRMGIAKQLRDVEAGFRIVDSFPKFAKLPIVLSESDPEGCAACSARVYPQNSYRNGALYAVYTAVAMKGILDLAQAANTNMEGMLTWAFEFEGQPYFDGFRTLATNGIDKPVINLFRMAAKMSGERLKVESSEALSIPDLLTGGAGEKSDIDAIASKSSRQISVMAWNYGDNESQTKERTAHLLISGIRTSNVKVHRYQIDQQHSNSWTVWKAIGSPQTPTAEQYAQLEKAGQLDEALPVESAKIRNHRFETSLKMPAESLTLIQLDW